MSRLHIEAMLRPITVSNPAVTEAPSGDNVMASAQEQRVVLVLNERDFENFLACGIPPNSENVTWNHCPVYDKNGFSWSELLESYDPTILVTGWSTPPLTKEIIQSPSFRVRYICHLTGSVRKVLPSLVFEKGILVSNWGTIAGTSVAEHAILMVLACLRELTRWKHVIGLPVQNYSHEKKQLLTMGLSGKRVGLHGFGNIAREVVRLLQPFNVTISSYSAGVPVSVMQEQGVTACQSLESLFDSSEVLIECEALTEQNRQSIGAKLLKRLPDQAVFVNVGRGAIVDEQALIAEAQNGRLRVGLDVLSKEPPSSDSALLTCDNILLSPHIGGPTRDRYLDCSSFAMENIQRYLAGQSVQAMVDIHVYNRST
jgi:phosphoglycerate dehydrogenase-like enzyme